MPQYSNSYLKHYKIGRFYGILKPIITSIFSVINPTKTIGWTENTTCRSNKSDFEVQLAAYIVSHQDGKIY